MFEINKNEYSEKIVTKEFLSFFETFHISFEKKRQELLLSRIKTQEFLDNGGKFSFPDDKSIRDSEWLVAPPPEDVANRNVEITGPVDRKMIINALNSGADVFMADFEDSTTPTWNNIINGHINLIDANKKNLFYQDVEKRKSYELDINSKTSLFVRPRGLHLDEKNIMYDGNSISASLFDFCMYIFHNADTRLKNGLGSYFYIPKLETAEESQL